MVRSPVHRRAKWEESDNEWSTRGALDGPAHDIANTGGDSSDMKSLKNAGADYRGSRSLLREEFRARVTRVQTSKDKGTLGKALRFGRKGAKSFKNEHL